MTDAKVARKRWELSNSINEMSADSIYKFDAVQHQSMMKAKPWVKDHNYFTHVKISALALLKMTIHARSGGNNEIMGMLIGKIDANVMIVMDSFALPVEGTETRVNAHEDANAYMTEYLENMKKIQRRENAMGWYHSHPGYGCWLSGIDVATQSLHQQYEDPFLSVVIDPIRTISAGRVSLGAFRTYPKGYQTIENGVSESQSIPSSKLQDFGAHACQYYSLEVSYFKSTLDTYILDRLWHQYWLSVLSRSTLLSNDRFNTERLSDIADTIATANKKLTTSRKKKSDEKPEEDHLQKAAQDSCKTTIEVVQGLMTEAVKDQLFNLRIKPDKVDQAPVSK